MLKNNRGVTLVSLVITIFIMIILGGITIKTSNDLIKNTKKRTIISDMYIIKAEALAIYDEYQFSEDENDLVGEKYTDLSEYGIDIEAEDLWYAWDQADLEALNLETEMLPSEEYFIVNYVTGEIIYSEGFKDVDGVKKYTLTDMLKVVE